MAMAVLPANRKIILKEIPDGWHIAGGLITLVGIFVVHRSSQGA